jgi:hypothetical protein
MKTHPSNNAQQCAPIIGFSSLSPSSRDEIMRILSDRVGSSDGNTGRSQFIIVEIPAGPAKPSRGKSVKGEQDSAAEPLGKVEARELYDEYYPFYEAEYVASIKKTDTYGAKGYAAEKTIEKIRVERQIDLTKRNVIVAMNLRMSK